MTPNPKTKVSFKVVSAENNPSKRTYEKIADWENIVYRIQTIFPIKNGACAPKIHLNCNCQSLLFSAG